MSTDVTLRCRCGQLRGKARKLSPRAGTRIVCYCTDCQAFGRFLGQPGILDAAGGTDIFQMAPGDLHIESGSSEIACMRLSDKGMHRWYARCCRTPIGNTLGAGVPFIGVIHAIMDLSPGSRDEVLGKPVAVCGKEALGGLPAGAHPGVPFSVIRRTAVRMLGWLLTGRGKNALLFDPKTRAPSVPPQVLSSSERDALRMA